MTTLFSSDFDSETTGVLPSGWTASVGSWAVGTTQPVSGTKTLESTSKAAGDVLLRTGEAAQGDCVFSFSSKVVDALSFPNKLHGVIMRMGAGYTNGYLWLPSGGTGGNITWGWWKRTGSSWSQIDGFSTNIGALNGDTIHFEAKSVGSTHEFRVWKNAEPRPETASATRTDSAFTSGHPGFYYASGGAQHTAIDDVLYEDVATAATGVTMSGPSSGTVGEASTNFTIGANGTITGTVTVTPSDGGAGGTFTPTSVAISSGTPTATFTYTAASTGAKTISVTNNGGLSNPANITFTAGAAANNIGVTNANLFFSPYNWYSDGGGAMQANNVKGSSAYAQSNNPGAYLKFRVTLATAGDVVARFDNAHLATIGASDFPQLAVFRDGGAPTLVQLSGTAAQSITLANSLAPGTYSFVVLFKSCNVTSGDRWTTPRLSVKCLGLTIPSDATMASPVLRSRNMVIFGDSITEGVSNRGTTSAVSDQDAGYTWAQFLAASLDAEVGIVGFGGSGWHTSGAGGPQFQSAWNFYSDSRSRLIGGALSPAPDSVVICHGVNDSATGLTNTINNVLTAIRAACACRIYVLIPFDGSNRAAINAATLPADTYRYDVNLADSDGSHLRYWPGFQAPLHPSVEGSAFLAPRIAKLIDRGGIKTTRTVSVRLLDKNGNPRANLTGLKWAWWDSPKPNLHAAPTDQGAAETTDASGNHVITVRSALAVSGIGWLDVSDSDGTPTQLPAAKAFSGPVSVT